MVVCNLSSLSITATTLKTIRQYSVLRLLSILFVGLRWILCAHHPCLILNLNLVLKNGKKLEQNLEMFPLKTEIIDCFERQNIDQVTYTNSRHLENFRYVYFFLEMF